MFQKKHIFLFKKDFRLSTLKLLTVLFLLFAGILSAQEIHKKENTFFQPTKESSKPWTYWYWMQSAYSKEGITADLEAMKRAGIEGAYLMTIKGPANPPLIDPPVLQLSKEFWDLVHWALTEADRVGVKIGFHPADGFAVAGGPWITPEMSMQKVVWKDTIVSGNNFKNLKLAVPNHYKDYYKDIAAFAIPVKESFITSDQKRPKITSTNPEADATILSSSDKDGLFRMPKKGWIQYEFEEPFLCKSIQIETKGNNYQAHRLIIEVSDDGKIFRSLGRLTTPRHGWQDIDAFYTHSIVPTKAKYFRFVYDPEETEPGAEDLDPAKWNQGLKVSKIYLSNESLIDNYQGKSGVIWRLSPQTTEKEINAADCVDLSKMINISKFVDANGVLNWKASAKANWRIIRFGHTSTGHENATAGAGRGLEVDKFNTEAIRFQLDHWFGEMLRVAGPELASKVVRILHMDSWECGSQNWSPVFRNEFKTRRGYDIVDYLPVMAGIPVKDIQTSEKVLYDVRKTISELVAEYFFGTLRQIADDANVKFSSENVAPTMMSDGLLHFKYIDYPSGEFWLKSPTHDKPNDMLDAISGGHIYGKDIIQAEAFTALKMDWDEHPGNLKVVADRNYALGINRFFYHVFVHNPWLDRKPGMTLDGIGSYFQRDQTWWEPGKAWFEYCQRVQFQLQKGKPVIDLAVFIGEDLPSRSILPDRLVPFIPNVFGKERVESEAIRLKNEGQPSAKMPKEVSFSKKSTDLSQWINAMNGYQYDSFNSDILINRAKVENGKISFEGGIEYGALLFPGSHKMAPNKLLSLASAEKMLQLVKDGATIFVDEKPNLEPGLQSNEDFKKWQNVIDEIWNNSNSSTWKIGKGTVIKLPYLENDFASIGITQDVYFPNLNRTDSETIAWTHRKSDTEDIYFISNQKEEKRSFDASFRIAGKIPVWYNPVTDKTSALANWKIENGRTILTINLDANESGFVIFKEETKEVLAQGKSSEFEKVQTLDENWELQFDPAFKGLKEIVKTNKLFDWSTSDNDQIKYYSGTVVYKKEFDWKGKDTNKIWIDLGKISNIAEIKINGKDCGTLWTFPFKTDISQALKKGKNIIEINITNTWANRLMGDQKLPKEERLTWTNATYRLEGEPLLKAGLLGPVVILKEKKK
ncbi:alpha-L-rhamnosidase [Flavobacterium sp. CF108]|uniref:glycosyl hydrolase n=1 Tax=unclassified Flavobacterium TaxID=196869 RepID=UPI0008CC49B3|nr:MULTISPECIES: glycosyl hydrolase [unclassified Flavobacterium]SEO66482.1 Glycosyl hydrolases family 2, sugar binding domain [Flavobacterium sp. fv08]SHH88811.1 alpha-L-rhamnosidase [Flavobacterium sp. CF108]